MNPSRVPIACSLLLAACGPSAPVGPAGPPPGPSAPPGPPAPAPLQVRGELRGRPFAPVAAALIYRQEGWTLVIADQHPDDSGELPVQATDVSLVIGRGADLPAESSQTGTTTNALITLGASSPGGDRVRVDDAVGDFQVQLADVQRAQDDPELDYPQVVGRARARFRAAFRTQEGAPVGQLEGELGTIPILFGVPPEDACRQLVAAPGTERWTDAPSARAIPDAPVVGEARGHAFSGAATRILQTSDGRWRLEIADRPYQDPAEAMPHGQYLIVDLESPPRARARITKRMAAGGGYWQICEGLGTTSWNADNAYYLEITSWNVTPAPPDLRPGQRAALGTASGRVYVSYRGFEPADNSWVGGRFTDAPVVVEGARPAD